MYGNVESMNVSIGIGKRESCWVIDSFVVVEVIDCNPRTRSREMSVAKAIERLLRINREES